ncbi:MAG: hypothetical protein NUW06_07200 [Candidatus Acetothermia bacterium]|nr:hypothetical protein [Candidatus Acetothermia bacterium]MDH7505503.1 hypothetical protein [Candidatus Acetothermia bacterium]
MQKRLVLVAMVALLLGLLLFLPGAMLEGEDQSPAAQTGSTTTEEEAQPESFLQALAQRLGISVERLERAFQETQNELIEKWVDQWAEKLKEQLTQAQPPQLLQRLTRKQVGQSLKGQLRLNRQIIVAQPESRQYLPYYWPSPYNCVCYCYYPHYPYYMPLPLQPGWPQPWDWFQLPLPETVPQPEQK